MTVITVQLLTAHHLQAGTGNNSDVVKTQLNNPPVNVEKQS